MIHTIKLDKSRNSPSKKIVWVTDLHLDAVDKPEIRAYFKSLKECDADLIIVGGDISNGSGSLVHLLNLAEESGKPVYYVLGNHDFYYNSIDKVRSLAERTKSAHYLSSSDPIYLSEKTVLIGHDSWSDGREGDFINSSVLLNDYLFIEDLKGLSKFHQLEKIQALGDQAAKAVGKKLDALEDSVKEVIILTHTPPFKEVCLYEGKPTDSNWGPHFVCKAMGEVIKLFAQNHPEKKLLVLSGHTHHFADVMILPNLRAAVGFSLLGEPGIAGFIEL